MESAAPAGPISKSAGEGAAAGLRVPLLRGNGRGRRPARPPSRTGPGEIAINTSNRSAPTRGKGADSPGGEARLPASAARSMSRALSTSGTVGGRSALVQNRQAVDIATPAHLGVVPCRLLGRHVTRRAGDHSGRGRRAPGSKGFRQSEVGHVGAPSASKRIFDGFRSRWM